MGVDVLDELQLHFAQVAAEEGEVQGPVGEVGYHEGDGGLGDAVLLEVGWRSVWVGGVDTVGRSVTIVLELGDWDDGLAYFGGDIGVHGTLWFKAVSVAIRHMQTFEMTAFT